jgi:hypothetical protein
MRMLQFLLSYALLNIFALLAAMFLAQNLRVERLTFFGIIFTINFVWILLGSVTFGFLAACLLLLPGRIAAHLHSWTLDHEAEELENQVGLLMQQREDMLSRLSAMMATQERVLARYQRLLADHSQVVAELDKAKAKSLALATATVAAEPRAARAIETTTAVATARRTTSAAAPVTAAARTTAPVAAVDTATGPAVLTRTEPAVQTFRNLAARTPWDWTARALRDSAKARLSKSFARLLPEPAPPPLSQAAVDSQPQLFETQLFEPGIDASADLAMVND